MIYVAWLFLQQVYSENSLIRCNHWQFCVEANFG
jgi:hypothetical protein